MEPWMILIAAVVTGAAVALVGVYIGYRAGVHATELVGSYIPHQTQSTREEREEPPLPVNLDALMAGPMDGERIDEDQVLVP